MRVPTVMWWPGRIPAGKVCGEIAASMDLFPTCAEIAGAKLPEGRIIDGRSLLPILEAREGARSPHAAFFYRTEAVRSGKWKLKGKALYNLESDIGEAKDVAGENPEVFQRLSDLLAAHKKDLARNKRPEGGPPRAPKNPEKQEKQEKEKKKAKQQSGLPGRP